ncbi:hypothetical protein K9K77_01145 [Candidatus Babeliales bacterium]|nr:hypothetical protein [Candidatus Babeliales bacterium]
MKKNFLFLLFLTPFIINTAEQDYRPALRAAIEKKDEEKVQSIIAQLPKGTIPEVNSSFSFSEPQNPLYIDTSPAIVKILLDSGVSPSSSIAPTSMNHQVDCQTDYASVALLLSRGGSYSARYSLNVALRKNKDHRIICTLLMAGAIPDQGPFSDFYTLAENIQQNSSPKNLAWSFLTWTAMTIATEKKEGWEQTLQTLISLYPTPELAVENHHKVHYSRMLLERQKIRNFNTEETYKYIFQKRYKNAFELWLTSSMFDSNNFDLENNE